MNTRPTLLQIACCAFLLFSATFTSAEDTPWYQVEVIVFSQQDIFSDENNRRDIKPEFPGNMVLLKETANGARAHLPPLPALLLEQPAPLSQLLAGPGIEQVEYPPAYVSLENSARQLKSEAYSLNRTGVYKVLYHQAWRQPGLDDRQAPWVYVAGGESFSNHRELEGSLRLVKERYLHVQVNLWRTLFDLANTAAGLQPDSTSIVGEPASAQNPRHQLPWPELPTAPTRPEDPRVQQLRDLVVEYEKLKAEEQAELERLNAEVAATDAYFGDEFARDAFPGRTTESADLHTGSAPTSTAADATGEVPAELTAGSDTESMLIADSAIAGETLKEPVSTDSPTHSLLEESEEPRYQVIDMDYLKETQRVDTSNLFYFDHPRIGVIVKISNYELPVEEEAEPVSG